MVAAVAMTCTSLNISLRYSPLQSGERQDISLEWPLENGFCKESPMPSLSFITANYVARALNYNGDTDWTAHDAATMRTIDGQAFGAICNDIAAAGFEAIDIWTAHC